MAGPDSSYMLVLRTGVTDDVADITLGVGLAVIRGLAGDRLCPVMEFVVVGTPLHG